MFIIILFIFITFILIMMLNGILGVRIGFFRSCVTKEPNGSKASPVKDMCNDAALLQGLASVHYNYRLFDPIDFINKSKVAFGVIFDAYAAGDKSTLRSLLSPKIYNAFVMAIDDRQSRGETLDGNLIRFVDASIIDAHVNGSDIYVDVKFITEQSNVLKSSNGDIIEGYQDYVENRTDMWVFHRKKSSTDPKWFLHEIKDEKA